MADSGRLASRSAELLAAMAVRTGHFTLESGHHGDLWLDLDRLFVRPAGLRQWAADLAAELVRHDVSAVCGPMTGGALLAQLVAGELAANCYYTERDASIPGAVSYRLPTALRAELAGARVAVVDDVINAGSAVRKTLDELDTTGARTVVLGALLTLGPSGAELAAGRGVAFTPLATTTSGLWTPGECPLCQRGVPLDQPG